MKKPDRAAGGPGDRARLVVSPAETGRCFLAVVSGELVPCVRGVTMKFDIDFC